MSRILSMAAYIANSTTHENVSYLGKWNFGVCVDTGISSAVPGQVPEREYDFFVGLVDDIYSFGGNIQIRPVEITEENTGIIKRYVPAVSGVTIPSIYCSSEYELKLVNSAGDYAVKRLTDSGGSRLFHAYNSETGATIGFLDLSGNIFDVYNNNVCYGGLVVSSFGSDGSFVSDSEYYAFSFNSSRYWNLRDVTDNYDENIINFLNNIQTYTPPTSADPYEEGGTSEVGGGTGDFDGTGDLIEIPSLPTLSAVDAGFITLFNPTTAQLGQLASYMWSDLFDLDGWRKIFADPMNAILGLSIVPVNVPSGGARAVKVGNISTGVNMTVATSQYVEVDCGTLNVNEFWGAYLDYDPYTKAEIYLPYIGTHALSVDDIMGKSVHVVYHVDILSGACCAYVQCGGTVIYTFIGQCSSSIPITGDNWTNVINGVLSIAGSIGSMVATGGASAPMAIEDIASTSVNALKPSVEKSGAMGGTGGMMGVQTPYLILTRPRQALPARQNTFTGYPSFITETLSNLSGYTEVFSIHLENVPATEQELAEIESLLKSGVIF